MIIFLDACAIIYWVEAVDEWFSRLQMTIGAVSKDRAMFAVSMLSLLECTVKPMRDGNQDILGSLGIAVKTKPGSTPLPMFSMTYRDKQEVFAADSTAIPKEPHSCPLSPVFHPT